MEPLGKFLLVKSAEAEEVSKAGSFGIAGQVIPTVHQSMIPFLKPNREPSHCKLSTSFSCQILAQLGGRVAAAQEPKAQRRRSGGSWPR